MVLDDDHKHVWSERHGGFGSVMDSTALIAKTRTKVGKQLHNGNMCSALHPDEGPRQMDTFHRYNSIEFVLHAFRKLTCVRHERG
jgi:hypothetical protein